MRVLAFVFPQSGLTDRLRDYLVSVDVIEAATGLDFFSVLPDGDEDRLEERRANRVW